MSESLWPSYLVASKALKGFLSNMHTNKQGFISLLSEGNIRTTQGVFDRFSFCFSYVLSLPKTFNNIKSLK
jgi:hypothetical protein